MHTAPEFKASDFKSVMRSVLPCVLDKESRLSGAQGYLLPAVLAGQFLAVQRKDGAMDERTGLTPQGKGKRKVGGMGRREKSQQRDSTVRVMNRN